MTNHLNKPLLIISFICSIIFLTNSNAFSWGMQYYSAPNLIIPTEVCHNEEIPIDVSGTFFYYPSLHGQVFEITVKVLEYDTYSGDETIVEYTETLYETAAIDYGGSPTI